MAVTLKGVTASWYLKDIAVAASGAYASFAGVLHLQTMGVNRTADQATLKNSSGEVVGEGYTNNMDKVTFKHIPSATSGAALLVGLKLPDPGDALTLTTVIGMTFISGFAYIVDSADFDGDNSSPNGFTISAHRYKANDVSANAAA